MEPEEIKQSVLAVIEENPGIDRQKIFDKLWPDVLQTELTNSLTTLRRRGKIENRGSKKYPSWYRKEQDEIASKSKDDLMEVFRQSDERLRRSLDHISRNRK